MPCHGCTIRRRAEKSDVGDGRTNPGDLKRRQQRAMKTSTAVAQALEPLHALFDKTTTLPGRRVTVARAAWDGQILITCYENRFLPFIFFSFFPSLSLSLSRTSHIMQTHTHTGKHHRLPGILLLAIILRPALQASILVQGTFPGMAIKASTGSRVGVPAPFQPLPYNSLRICHKNDVRPQLSGCAWHCYTHFS